MRGYKQRKKRNKILPVKKRGIFPSNQFTETLKIIAHFPITFEA